jgi:hypothetical protein
MAPLIYNLIRFTRPRRVLEIGSGYTSAFILQALADNVASHEAESGPEGRESPLVLKSYYEQPYIPRLDCIDTLANSSSSANRVSEFASQTGLAQYLHFHQADFRGYGTKVAQEDGYFDFVWMDAGGWENYTAFLEEYWELINPAGGLWLIHSTQTNLEGLSLVNKLMLIQATGGFRDLEILSLLEPHKITQNSTTLVRRITEVVENVYTPGP